MSAFVPYQRCMDRARLARWNFEHVASALSIDPRLDMVPAAMCPTLRFLDPSQQRRLNHLQAAGYLWLYGALEEVVLRTLQWQALDHTEDNVAALDLLLSSADDARKHRAIFDVVLEQLDERCRLGFVAVDGLDHFAADVLSAPPIATMLLVALLCRAADGHAAAVLRTEHALDPDFVELLQLHAREERVGWPVYALEIRRMVAGADERSRAGVYRSLQRLMSVVDGLLTEQAAQNTAVFLDNETRGGFYVERPVRERMRMALRDGYRWAFLEVGIRQPPFARLLADVTPGLRHRDPDHLLPFAHP